MTPRLAVGAILANLLFALGAAFFLGGLRASTAALQRALDPALHLDDADRGDQLIVPSAFSRFFSKAENAGAEAVAQPLPRRPAARGVRPLPPLHDQDARRPLPQRGRRRRQGRGARAGLGVARAVASLVAASVLAAWMSEDPGRRGRGHRQALGMSQTFIGMVFLARGGAAESGSAIAMGRKGPDGPRGRDRARELGCRSRALRRAAADLRELLRRPEPDRALVQPRGGGSLLLAVLIGTTVSNDGTSTWHKGVQLRTVYAVLATLFYFIPT
jgi:Ca2+:H+ antiporter